MLAPVVPIVLLALWVETVYAGTSVPSRGPLNTHMTLIDLVYQPWLMVTKTLMPQHVALLSCTCLLFLIAAYLELIAVYCHLPKDGLLSRYRVLFGGRRCNAEISYHDVMSLLATEAAREGRRGVRVFPIVLRKEVRQVSKQVAKDVARGTSAAVGAPASRFDDLVVHSLDELHSLDVRKFMSAPNELSGKPDAVYFMRRRPAWMIAIYLVRFLGTLSFPLAMLVLVCAYGGYIALVATWWLLGE